MTRKLVFSLVMLALLSGCSENPGPSYDLDALVNAYGEVWNSGDFAPLDTLVTEEFEFRYNSSGPLTGVEPLINEIKATREPFTDFSLTLKDLSEVSDTVCLIDWEITGNRKGDGGAFRSMGFSVLFHAEGRVAGEWISFSDIGWVTGLGYKVSPPE
jgi:hypothetical protein